MLIHKKCLLIAVLCSFILLPVLTQATVHNVEIGDHFFSPLGTNVSYGDTVRWTWVGAVSHSSTSDAASPKLWNSGITASVGFTFDVFFDITDGPGPFPYLCTVHSLTMIDTIFIAGINTDTDGDGLNDAVEAYLDTDPASVDTDSDGVDDLTEVGDALSPNDTDSDGVIDALDTDDDGDGIPTDVELTFGDTDTDGIPNYLDTDDDDDTVPSNLEVPKGDTDSDGTPNYLDTDDDNDGIKTSTERSDGDDTDNDGTPNYLDTDDDGDSILTIDEGAFSDFDGDGVADYLDDDDDGDSIPTLSEVIDGDTDSDGSPNYLDFDDDGDGFLTIDEALNGDTDTDGIPDYLDDDDDGDSVLTITDNCPYTSNPAQEDFDNNGIGNVCDNCCIGLRGNVDGGFDDGTLGTSLDIADLVYLVSFMFTGGPTPPCMQEANFDASPGSVPIDITDLVGLVSFMFQGGAPPEPCS